MRYATLKELGPYVDYHRQMFIDSTIGLQDVQVLEDKEGAYALFLVKEKPNDQRERSIEATAGLMTFKTLESREWVRTRVKVKDLTA